MTEPQATTVQAEVPVRLLAEMEGLVEAGWFRNLNELMLDARQLHRASSHHVPPPTAR